MEFEREGDSDGLFMILDLYTITIKERFRMNYKNILSVFLIFILTFGICSTAFAVDDIPEGYTPIYTADDLNNVRNNLSGKYILMNHIDLSSFMEWNRIGSYETPFTGELDGNGYSILGFKSNCSLLGRIDNAVVKKLGIVDCAIIETDETASNSTILGAFAEHSINSTFEKCFVTGSIKPCVRVGMMTVMSSCCVGGLVGVSRNSTFVNCYNNAEIHFNYDKVNISKIGGLVGEIYNSNFECCYNAGAVSLENIGEVKSSNTYEGGLAGSADDDSLFAYCYFKDDLTFAIGKEKSNPNGTKILTNSQMKNKDEFVGFDFVNVWDMKNEYPLLRTNDVPIKKQMNLRYKSSCKVFDNPNTKIVSWESSDDNIAVVNDDGNVEGVGVGSATIFVETEAGDYVVLTINVTYTIWQMFIVYFLFGWMWY